MADRDKLLKALQNADAAASAGGPGSEEAAADARKLAAMLNNMQAAESSQGPEVPSGDPKTSYGGGLAQQALSGAAFNMGDEAMGGIAGLYGTIYNQLANSDMGKKLGMTGDSQIDMPNAPADLRERRNFKTGEIDSSLSGGAINKDITARSATQEIRDEMKDFETRNPKAALAANIGGSLVGGGLAGAKMLGAAPTTLGKVAGISALEGGLFGFGRGEGRDDSLQKGFEDAVVGAVAGPLAKMGMDKVSKMWNKGEATKLREALDPTKNAEDLKTEAQKFYKTADESGFQVKPEKYNQFKTEMEALLQSRAITGKRYPRLGKAISYMRSLKNPSYQELEAIKDMLEGARTLGDDSAQYMYGNQFAKAVDNLVDDLKPGDVTGDITNVSEHLKKARDLWTRKTQSELLDEMKYKAELSNAELDLDNMDKAIRQQIRPTLVNPKRKIAFDDETISSLEDIISGRGSMLKRRARAGEKIAPNESTARGFFPQVGAAIMGVASTGSPAGMIAGIIPGLSGGIARRIANNITAKEFARLQRDVANKGQLEIQQVLYELMKEKDLLRGAAATAAGGATGTTLDSMTGN